MSHASAISKTSERTLGQQMHDFAAELYPTCRSITGDGIRQTLRRISDHIPLRVLSVPTGTHVFDWTVPKEWNIFDAYIADERGKRIIDFRDCNLHVVSYSTPIHQTLSFDDLR